MPQRVDSSDEDTLFQIDDDDDNLMETSSEDDQSSISTEVEDNHDAFLAFVAQESWSGERLRCDLPS